MLFPYALMAGKYRFAAYILCDIKKVKFALDLEVRFGIIRAVSADQIHLLM